MRLPAALLALATALFALAGPAHGQGDRAIDFGDNTSAYADNGECDDPRFEGDGMASILVASDLGHDAADCSAGVEAGTIALKPLPALPADAPSQALDDIDFGTDDSSFAFDGACDDSRFGGPAMASVLIEEDIGRDASDCRKGIEGGDLVFFGVPTGTLDPDAALGEEGGERFVPDLAGIDFGDNESPYALNDVCDDRRFHGEGMAGYLLDSDTGHDALDCATATLEGTVAFRRPVGSIDEIDFGDDASSYALNQECDDPRFTGEGMAGILLEGDIGHDASDCRAGVEAGQLQYVGASGEPIAASDPGSESPEIDFGDDDSSNSEDGLCDDKRFDGPGMADRYLLSDEDVGHDASDCRTALAAGTIVYDGEPD